jgi:predicted patatin/cPLA2 family phospholipase
MILSPPQLRNLVLLMACLLLASCESKISQCRKIINVHNQIVLDAQKLANGGTAGDTTIVQKSSEIFAKGAESMGAIDAQDAKLTELKNQFTTMYQNYSQITKQILDNQAKKKSGEVAKGREKLKEVASPEKNLVDSINSYCGGTSSPVEGTSPNSDKK